MTSTPFRRRSTLRVIDDAKRPQNPPAERSDGTRDLAFPRLSHLRSSLSNTSLLKATAVLTHRWVHLKHPHCGRTWVSWTPLRNRFPMPARIHTLRIIDGIHSGEVAKAEYENFGTFNLSIPTSLEGVPSELLNSRKARANKEGFERESESSLGCSRRRLPCMRRTLRRRSGWRDRSSRRIVSRLRFLYRAA